MKLRTMIVMHSAVLLAAGLMLSLPSTALGQAVNLDKLFLKRTSTDKEGALPYRLMAPHAYKENVNTYYPLVVFLHGAGECGTDNKSQLNFGIPPILASPQNRKKHPCFLLVPQCPPDSKWSIAEAKAGKPAGAGRVVLAMIDRLGKHFRIDRKRIYVTGFSLGGNGTWNLLTAEPAVFAAGIPVCGWGDPKQASRLTRIPIWNFHNDGDDSIPVKRSRDMIAAIRKDGGKPLYKEYKAAGHDAWSATYHNPKVIDWLFAQRQK